MKALGCNKKIQKKFLYDELIGLYGDRATATLKRGNYLPKLKENFDTQKRIHF